MDQFQALRLLLALLVSIAIAALAISARPRGWLFRNLLDCFFYDAYDLNVSR